MIIDQPFVLISLTALMGLSVGSLITVIAYRLPLMMKREWRNDCAEFLNLPHEKDPQTRHFNLVWPLPHCPHCETKLGLIEAMPIVSYFLQKGQCRHCHTAIPLSYPVIEIITTLASGWVAWHFGYSLELAAALLLTWALITLSAIDIKHQLLPDTITLPLVWLGLFMSLTTVWVDSHDSIIGAIGGYLFLWLIYHLFKLTTGKEGMGHGDFKLLAVLGAWLGWQALLPVILLSSVVAVIVGVAMIIFIKHDKRIPIPFGPYLSVAGWLTLLWGGEFSQMIGY